MVDSKRRTSGPHCHYAIEETEKGQTIRAFLATPDATAEMHAEVSRNPRIRWLRWSHARGNPTLAKMMLAARDSLLRRLGPARMPDPDPPL